MTPDDNDHDDTSDAQREMLTLLTARVRDAALRTPLRVDAGTDIPAVCRLLAEHGRTGTLVTDAADAQRLGIFTTTDLRDAMARPSLPATVGEVSHFDLYAVAADADLFEAMWLMLRHRVHRLLVSDRDGSVLGVLGQAELVASVAAHSHIVALQIDQARTVDELVPAAQRVDALVALLADGGIKVERIARVVGTLNRRLIERAWTMVAPTELVAHSCLLVMGSEGRCEQIEKTDQDNALVLDDALALSDDAVRAAAKALADALGRMGWPPCTGHIMVTNPRWCASVAALRETLREWVHGDDPDGPMNLAIFFDAAVVAGDATLLVTLRDHLERVVSNSDAFLARFAAAADQFELPSSWWQRLTGHADDQPLDLKKLGTFPIVHGMRALALAHRVRAPDTVQRIRALIEVGVLDADLGRDLTEALHYLMGLKLRRQLAQRAAGAAPTNLARPSELSTMERDQLKDAIAITRRLRELLRKRFSLDSL
jgi:CBS domain-containing protein